MAMFKTQKRPNAVIAAATVGSAQVASAKRGNEWAEQAWAYYDAVGELRYAANWLGNALSRAQLIIAKEPDEGAQPERVDDNEAANDALTALAGGVAGQAEMLKAFGLHLTVAGDSYLVGLDDKKGDQRWLVRSPEEVNAHPGKVTVRINGLDKVLDDDDVALIRIWRPHPRRSWEADSPTRGVLPVLHELERLTQMVLASANSRLAGAGLLLIPQEFDFATPSNYPMDDGQQNQPGVASAQNFVNRLGHAMIAPVTDRSDPGAVVPVVVTAPGEHIPNVRLIQFSTPLDAQAIELRKEAIRRFALGMDMPPEILLGMGDSSHWNAWQIDEAAIKLHIEPLLSLICDALTVEFLRPQLGEDSDLIVWFDTTELVQRPNRGPESLDLYRLDIVGAGTVRREFGYSEDDAPKDEELDNKQLRAMVSTGGGVLATQASIKLGLFTEEELGLAEEQVVEEQTFEPVVEETDQVEEQPDGTADRPGPPASGGDTEDLTAASVTPVAAKHDPAKQQATLAALTPVLVAHALDYIGKRWMKGQRRGDYPKGLRASRIHEQIPIPEDKVDEIIVGAFDALAGTAPDHLLSAVLQYVRHLVTTGTRNDPGRLMSALTSASRKAKP